MGQTQIAHHHGVTGLLHRQLGGHMDNVIPLHPDNSRSVAKEWQKDVDDYGYHYEHAEPFSSEKNHLSLLLCMIIENEKVPFEVRVRACQVLYRYSDTRAAIDTVYGDARPRTKDNETLEAIKKW